MRRRSLNAEKVNVAREDNVYRSNAYASSCSLTRLWNSFEVRGTMREESNRYHDYSRRAIDS